VLLKKKATVRPPSSLDQGETMSKREIIILSIVAVVVIILGLFVGAWDDAELRSPRTAEAAEPAPVEFINGPVVAYERAERLTPPTTTAEIPELPMDGPAFTAVEGRCTQYEPLLTKYAGSGWDVNWISKIMWRESRCTTGVVSNTGCCVSLLQLYVNLHLRDHRLKPLYNACGVYAWQDLDGREDAERHICAASALYSVVGKQAWAL
jgi:hypothetical protein